MRMRVCLWRFGYMVSRISVLRIEPDFGQDCVCLVDQPSSDAQLPCSPSEALASQPKIQSVSLRTVVLTLPGGGFAYGGAPDRRYNLSFIVQNSVEIGKPIIAASIAYRLGPFGFLNGDAVSDAGAINLGLKDQRLALHWINENIAAFGGDKEKVTIWGESAGAASVGLHLTAFNGRDDKLFRAAIMESGGPIFFGEQQNSSDYQLMYDSVVQQAGCGNVSDSLGCLREVPFTVLNSVLNATEFNTPGWWPALDGDFVARYGSEQLNEGAFVHVPIISGANSDEGTAFSPRGVDTEEELIAILNGEFWVFLAWNESCGREHWLINVTNRHLVSF